MGWGINIYPSMGDQCFKFVLDGAFNGINEPLNLWELADGQDTAFTLTYDLRSLTLTAERAGQTVSASREVNLVSAMNGTSAWIGFTGATGGSYARQLVYDFVFTYDEADLTSRYANPFVVEGAAQMNLGLGTVGSFGMLIGFILAEPFEERFVKFENTSNLFRCILRTLGGGAIYFGLNTALKMPFPKELLDAGDFTAQLIRTGRYAAVIFVVIGVYPLLFRLTGRLWDRKTPKL